MICLVHSYPGANSICARNYPTWKQAGFDKIIGIGTTDGGCTWPDNMSYVNIGVNSYVDRDVLPRRLVDTVQFMTSLAGWDEACIIEYDVIMLKPFPSIPKGFSSPCKGGPQPWRKGNKFFHPPWVADRDSWNKILIGGLECLKAGEIEGGSPDCFIGWVCDRHGIPIHENTFTTYSRNTIDNQTWMEEARVARHEGATAIHGCKTKECFDHIFT
jgi:hypothetical protein